MDLTKVRLYGVALEKNALDHTAWNRMYVETDREIALSLETATYACQPSDNARRESIGVTPASTRSGRPWSRPAMMSIR